MIGRTVGPVTSVGRAPDLQTGVEGSASGVLFPL